MKRSVLKISLLTLCMSALFTAGCHGTKQQESFVIPETFDTSASYEITFWAKNDTNKRQVEIYNKAVSSFNELYPNITVNIRLYTDYGAIYNDVITNISTGTTPNVCITYPDHIATYMTGKNVVVPLDDLFTNEKYGFGGSELKFDSPTLAEVVPKFLDECVVACRYISGFENIGKLYELCPLNVSVALDAGIRCQAFKISIYKRRNYLLPEKRCAVMRMVSDV